MSILPQVDRPDPVHCQHCGEGFQEPRDLALHRGRRHADAISEAERAIFEEAVDDEQAWLGSFRRHLVAGLATLPVLLTYAMVVITGYVYEVNPAMMWLPVPGILGFTVLTYAMTYRRVTFSPGKPSQE